MIKERIKIGEVVKTNKGIGMITYIKNNEEIGINYDGYRIVTNVRKELTSLEQKDIILRMGVDDMISKKEIIEKIK